MHALQLAFPVAYLRFACANVFGLQDKRFVLTKRASHRMRFLVLSPYSWFFKVKARY